ncbi:MAG: protein kinase [Deltaproteobacteria bacterium]|nr:protein kinase [Deltaproteobacteria bacterium]
MEQLGPYDLVERLGQGGMAEVFLARRQVEGVEKRLVIKRILPDFAEMSDFVQMFINEARIAATLEHPNITQLLDFGQVDGRYILAIEYVQGTDFAALIRNATAAGEFLPEEVVLKIAAFTCEALAYAHALTDENGEALGFIHRDISPDNILLGANGAVKVSDFGIAKLRTLPKVTKTGTLKGKPAYAAPEYLRGKGITPQCDLFSLGVVIFEGLTGRKPFEGADLLEVMRKVVKDPTPDIADYRANVPEAVVRVVERAMQKEPADRYADAGEMLADIEAALHELGRPATGRVIAAQVARWAPGKKGTGNTPVGVEAGNAPTAIKSDPKAPAPGTDATYIAQKSLAPMPAANATVGGRGRTAVQPKVPVGRASTVAANSAPPPTRTAANDARPPSRKSASKWASVEGEDAPETLPEKELDPVLAAQKRAFELADEELDDDEERRRRPGMEGTKPKVPMAALVGVMVVCGLGVVGFMAFAPKQHRILQHAEVSKTPDKQLVVNVVNPNLGADVFINGGMIGHTPLTVDNTYPFGQHVAVDIRALGFPPLETEFIGGIGQKIDVTFAQPPPDDE